MRLPAGARTCSRRVTGVEGAGAAPTGQLKRRTHGRTLPQHRFLLESLFVSSYEFAEGCACQDGVIVDEQQNLGTLATDAAVGASPLPLRFPHCESIWKSGRHLLSKKSAAFVFADPAGWPRQAEVKRRAHVGRALGAARGEGRLLQRRRSVRLEPGGCGCRLGCAERCEDQQNERACQDSHDR